MPQRLRHPKPCLPDDLQQQDDQHHLPKQRERSGPLSSFDLEEQLRREQFRQVDRQADEHPRQKDAQVEGTIFQKAQEGRKKRRLGVVVQTLEVFAEEGRQDHRGWAPVDENDDLPLTELRGGHGGALGVAHRGGCAHPAGEQPGQKVARIQQQLRLCAAQRLFHLLHGGRRGLVFAVADGIFRFHRALCLLHFHHQCFGADEPPQQAQVDPQQVGKALAGAAQIPLSGGFLHRAEFQALHRKCQPFRTAVQQ